MNSVVVRLARLTGIAKTKTASFTGYITSFFLSFLLSVPSPVPPTASLGPRRHRAVVPPDDYVTTLHINT